ncbi:MAG: metal-dependent transcriptional regulator [Acidilobus sp.]
MLTGERPTSSRRCVSPSLQEYLTAIYKRGGLTSWVRTTDMASDLGMAPASVTEAFRKLASMGYIDYIPYRGVRLTQAGASLAEPIVEREAKIKTALVKMGVSEAEADRLACILEHYMSDKAVAAVNNFVKRCGDGG